MFCTLFCPGRRRSNLRYSPLKAGGIFQVAGMADRETQNNLAGRWDRNRTCNLRSWSTRRDVQSRPSSSNLPLNTRFLARHRPESSKHVQPVYSQFCSQCDLRPSARRRPFLELDCCAAGYLKQPVVIITLGCNFREQVNMSLPLDHIFLGDCREVMKTFPDKSIELV